MNNSLRQWATPLAIATFTVSAITGILMFFHSTPGLVKPVHEWLSWALVAGVVLHTVSNLKQFNAYFSKNPGLVIIVAGLLITASSMLIPGEGGHGNPAMKITKALGSSSLESVAAVAHITPETAVGKLEKKGIKVSGTGASIHEIATENSREDIMVLGTVFE